MSMTLMIDNSSNNEFSPYSSARPVITPTGSYCKFYQTKLRQLLTRARYRREQEVRLNREKQPRNIFIDYRTSEQRLHKEYLNHLREQKLKMQSREVLAPKIDELKKGTESLVSATNHTVTTLSITTTYLTTPRESKTKPVIKPKQSPLSPKQPRLISAPVTRTKSLNERKVIPKIRIDGVEENLSKANSHSFTRVSSSSARIANDRKFHHARQSILESIMSHLDSYISTNDSKGPVYEDIDNRFSSSISPTVYESFERITI